MVRKCKPLKLFNRLRDFERMKIFLIWNFLPKLTCIHWPFHVVVGRAVAAADRLVMQQVDRWLTEVVHLLIHFGVLLDVSKRLVFDTFAIQNFLVQKRCSELSSWTGSVKRLFRNFSKLMQKSKFTFWNRRLSFWWSAAVIFERDLSGSFRSLLISKQRCLFGDLYSVISTDAWAFSLPTSSGKLKNCFTMWLKIVENRWEQMRTVENSWKNSLDCYRKVPMLLEGIGGNYQMHLLSTTKSTGGIY